MRDRVDPPHQWLKSRPATCLTVRTLSSRAFISKRDEVANRLGRLFTVGLAKDVDSIALTPTCAAQPVSYVVWKIISARSGAEVSRGIGISPGLGRRSLMHSVGGVILSRRKGKCSAAVHRAGDPDGPRSADMRSPLGGNPRRARQTQLLQSRRLPLSSTITRAIFRAQAERSSSRPGQITRPRRPFSTRASTPAVT